MTVPEIPGQLGPMCLYLSKSDNQCLRELTEMLLGSHAYCIGSSIIGSEGYVLYIAFHYGVLVMMAQRLDNPLTLHDTESITTYLIADVNISSFLKQ